MQAIGVDIGGTSIKFGIVDSSTGTILKEIRKPTPVGVEAVVEVLREGVLELTVAGPANIRRVGVGVPGAMDAERRLVRYPPNLKGWGEVPLRELLEKRLPDHTIEVDNDAKVATLAEAELGAGRGLTHFLLVTLGTGVGGGLWLTEGGRSGIARGASGGAGEFGHISIDYNGPQCACGARGCIEAYLGNAYLVRRTLAKLESDPSIDSTLRRDVSGLTPLAIATAMNAGDQFARSVFEEAGMLLGVALANVAKLLDIHKFIVGGGVADAGDVLFDAALHSLRANVLKNQRDSVAIRRAKFGANAGIIGAALLVSR